MTSIAVDSAPSSFLLFTGASVDPLQCSAGERVRYACGQHLVLSFSEGNGVYRLGEAEWPIESGMCTLLPPGCELELVGGSSDLRGYAVTFDVFAWGNDSPLDSVDKGWPYHRPVVLPNASRLLDPIDRLLALQSGESEATTMRRSILIQELVCVLLEEYEASAKLSASGDDERVQLTVRYMDEHYRDNVTVDLLARMAGMERSKYSAFFQAEMGQKPLEYLNFLRIDTARKLLENMDQPLREIAKLVGFNDEYYFSKRFAKIVGVPPGMYAKLSRQNADDFGAPRMRLSSSEPNRIVVTGYALGELLTLGIKPVGAEMAVIGSQIVYPDLLQGVEDVGWLGDPERVEPLRPDLIVLGCSLNRHYGRLSRIAPTAVVNNSLPSEERLLSVADLIGKRAEALNWIASHERRLHAVWQSLSATVRPGETATVLLAHRGRIYLMGMSGFAVTIYHPQGFRPSEAAAELIAVGEVYRELPMEALVRIDGDRVFLLADSREIGSRNVRRLMDSPGWRGMNAVKDGRLHVADSSWNYDDPITRDRLLPALPGIMRVHSSRRDDRSVTA